MIEILKLSTVFSFLCPLVPIFEQFYQPICISWLWVSLSYMVSYFMSSDFSTIVSNICHVQYCFGLSGLTKVPSMSTFDGVKRYINRMENAPEAAPPKQSVMLDWVSNEDGSHILTVAVGNKVNLLVKNSFHCQNKFWPFDPTRFCSLRQYPVTFLKPVWRQQRRHDLP